jgi:hypothetical protein
MRTEIWQDMRTGGRRVGLMNFETGTAETAEENAGWRLVRVAAQGASHSFVKAAATKTDGV